VSNCASARGVELVHANVLTANVPAKKKQTSEMIWRRWS
jgi:hypothetical protein